jgi:transposase, IS5 family
MLIDKYEADNIFEKVPGLTLKLSPELSAIDQVLDDDELFTMIRNDLAQRRPKTKTAGRHSTPVEVILRMLAVRHLFNWSYEVTEQEVCDSLVLRQFCRVYFQPVPDHTTLCKWARLIQTETLAAFNERIMALALASKLTRGRKLRMDGMVVETNIHHPSDSSLLADGVRVLGRTLTKVRQLLGDKLDLPQQLFRNRTRSAKKAARQIAKSSRQGQAVIQAHYRHLLEVAGATVKQVQQVLTAIHTHARQEGGRLSDILQTFLPRLEQVIDQARRRIFDNQSIPAAEKLVSLFEPHTDIICRGKVKKPTEFGHKVWLGEVEGGFIAQYHVLNGNPADDQQWEPTLKEHLDLFGHPPWQASADRGVHSAENEQLAHKLGVQRIVLPQPGKKSEVRRRYERQRWFWRGRRFHAGVEGRISVISRKHGLDRCRDKGEKGFHRWVGWGVIANNLTAMAKGLGP